MEIYFKTLVNNKRLFEVYTNDFVNLCQFINKIITNCYFSVDTMISRNLIKTYKTR